VQSFVLHALLAGLLLWTLSARRRYNGTAFCLAIPWLGSGALAM